MSEGSAYELYLLRKQKISSRSVVCSACIAVCALTIVVSCCMFLNDDVQQKRANELQATWQCLTNSSMADKDNACSKEYVFLMARPRFHRIPSQCLNTERVRNFLFENISRELHDSTKHLRKLVRSAEADQLQSLVAQSWSNSRFITHWGAFDEAGANISAHAWKPISKLRTDRSCYTISQGSEDAYVNGAVKIPQDGIYMIYAKVTVMCLKPDGMKKRVFFEVRMLEKFIKRDTALLHDVDSGVCEAEGDLLTIYLSGLMRLSKNNLIYMLVKLPDNVNLSNHDSMYKTHLGVSYVGLN